MIFQKVLLALVLMGMQSALFAGSAKEDPPGHGPSLSAPRQGERLSAYLLRQPPATDAFGLATQWITPAARDYQNTLYRKLVLSFSNVPSELKLDNVTDVQRLGWAQWLQALTPIGRQALYSADVRWLEANPNRDPMLTSQDRIVVPDRPAWVRIVKNNGGICQLKFSPNRSALSYARACEKFKRSSYAEGFIVQPDGAVIPINVSHHKESLQPAPAPGAWIWMPQKANHWPEEFNALLTTFLAGQGIGSPPTSEPILVAPSAGQKSTDHQQLTEGAEIESMRSASDFRALPVSASDWGGAGLLQTPSARFFTAGSGQLTISRTQPYTRVNVTLTPFEWLEAGFRYVDVSNRLYGPSIAGNQSYKDKSIDAKFRVFQETEFTPQMALGLRDLGGTGLFSGEYFVASKRWGRIDTSIGLGWGYLGSRQNLSNPFGVLDQRFNRRPTTTESAISGGEFNASTYFRGRTALFGGLQYHTPWERLTLKLELDGNNYQREPQNNNQTARSIFNIGAAYQLGKHTTLHTGIERGNALMIGISLGANFHEFATPKLDDPRPLPLAIATPAQVGSIDEPDWNGLISRLERHTNWKIQALYRRDRTLRVEIGEAGVFDWAAALEKANRVLHQALPREFNRFTYVVIDNTLSQREFTIRRDEWLMASSTYQPSLITPLKNLLPDPLSPKTVDANPLIEITPVRESITDQIIARNSKEPITAGLGLSYAQSLGGPDGFILYHLSAAAEAKLQISANTWANSVLHLRLLDNYDNFRYTAPSNLPRVRTYVREYITTSDLTMPRLQANHIFKLNENLVGAAYAGYLEPMFGGLGGELVYKPWGSQVALGADVNRVRQREFEQRFGFRDYEVTTGHATLYWKTGWQDVLAQISAGQYLAGDRGITVDLSREFKNGTRIGAFFTKTNVSAAQFGEGAFDKGIYVSIPFNAIMTRSSSQTAEIMWRPLLRDGGAKLNRQSPISKQF